MIKAIKTILDFSDWYIIFNLLTYIMSLVEHHYRLLGELFGHQVSYLGV